MFSVSIARSPEDFEVAAAIYRAFGFDFCVPFRKVPDAIGHTEVFLKREVKPA